MKRRLHPRYSIHRLDPVRIEVAGTSYRVFPLTDNSGRPHVFFRSMKEARDFCATEQLPNVLWDITALCGEDEDPQDKVKKISKLCLDLITELRRTRSSNTYAMTNGTVAQLQKQVEHEEKEYRRAIRKGRILD